MGRSILFLCILCSACVSNEEYPDDWPPVVVSDTECPDISGIYMNTGLYASTNEHSFERGEGLSDYIGGNYGAVGTLFEYVVISQSDAEEIYATLHHIHNLNDTTHKTYDTRTLFRELGHFVCEDGRIWITETAWGAGSPLYGVGRFKTRIGLAKAKDGSLIGEIQSSGGGVVFLFVPFNYSSEDYVVWSLFEPTYLDIWRAVIRLVATEDLAVEVWTSGIEAVLTGRQGRW